MRPLSRFDIFADLKAMVYGKHGIEPLKFRTHFQLFVLPGTSGN